MLLASKILLGAIGALMIFFGGRWMFAPDAIMREHDISTNTATGKNYLRGDMGGLLIGGGAAIFMFLYQGMVWALPILVIIGAVMLGRIVSLIADGKSKQGLMALGIELAIVLLVIGIAGLS